MFISFKFRKDQFFQNLNTIFISNCIIIFQFCHLKCILKKDIISSIVVDGNQRITTETIIVFLRLKKEIHIVHLN